MRQIKHTAATSLTCILASFCLFSNTPPQNFCETADISACRKANHLCCSGGLDGSAETVKWEENPSYSYGVCRAVLLQRLTPVSGRFLFTLQHCWVSEFLLKADIPTCHTGVAPQVQPKHILGGSNGSQRLWWLLFALQLGTCECGSCYLHSSFEPSIQGLQICCLPL